VDYRNEEWLREKYWEEELSAQEIADLTDVTDQTILVWMRKHDIPRRDMGTAVSKGKRNESVPMRTHKEKGYVYWRGKWRGEDMGRVAVHRLAAVAWFGYDAVADNVVHHKANIPWLNAEWNLEPLPAGDHAKIHEPWTYSPILDS